MTLGSLAGTLLFDFRQFQDTKSIHSAHSTRQCPLRFCGACFERVATEFRCGSFLGSDASSRLWRVGCAGLGRIDWAICKEERNRGMSAMILSRTITDTCRSPQWSVLGTASLLQFMQYGSLLVAVYRLSCFRCASNSLSTRI